MLLTLSIFSSVQAIDVVGLYEAAKGRKIDESRTEKKPTTCSPNVIPPGTPLNHFDLILTLGQDEALSTPAITLFTTSGYTDIFGWDSAKITAFREAAVEWYIERFGIDFSDGEFDPETGTILTDFGIMIPYRYQGDFRVLASTSKLIPPYTPDTPSSVGFCNYSAFFFSPPVYHGTYGGVGGVQGNATDAISFGAYRIFTNCKGTKFFTIFGRSHYPESAVPNVSGNRNMNRFQLFSPDFGPGFADINSAILTVPNGEGLFPTDVINTMVFPGTFQVEFSDWNGYTASPVTP